MKDVVDGRGAEKVEHLAPGHAGLEPGERRVVEGIALADVDPIEPRYRDLGKLPAAPREHRGRDRTRQPGGELSRGAASRGEPSRGEPFGPAASGPAAHPAISACPADSSISRACARERAVTLVPASIRAISSVRSSPVTVRTRTLVIDPFAPFETVRWP